MRGSQAVLALAHLAPRVALSASAQFQTHPVRSVPRGDRIVVEYAGLPVTVRLAQIVVPDSAAEEARAALESLVKGRRIRVAYCPEAGLDAEGLPQAYAIAGIKNVNQELVRRGLARYEAGAKRSRHYHQKMVSADAAARKVKAGIWASVASGPAERPAAQSPAVGLGRSHARGSARRLLKGRGVYSELNSSMYHLATCRWAKQMSPQRRIRYRSYDAAERAGKKPCWMCLAERAQGAMQAGLGAKRGKRVRVIRGKGPLVGHEGVFHAANCEKILDKAERCASHGTVGEARAAGLGPCTRCLRLSGGPIPLPQKGECVGRAPPHRRPCRRAPADDSGLCSYCQGKGE